jgi:hypothetical protein
MQNRTFSVILKHSLSCAKVTEGVYNIYNVAIKSDVTHIFCKMTAHPEVKCSSKTELYVSGLISFASTVIFLFTLDIARYNRFFVVAWYLSSIILHLKRTDAYRPHTVHIKMEEFSGVRFKQRAVNEFLTAEKCPPIEIHRRMQAFYGDQCADVSTVRRWIRRFKEGELGQADLSDKTLSGRPVTDFKN